MGYHSHAVCCGKNFGESREYPLYQVSDMMVVLVSLDGRLPAYGTICVGMIASSYSSFPIYNLLHAHITPYLIIKCRIPEKITWTYFFYRLYLLPEKHGTRQLGSSLAIWHLNLQPVQWPANNTLGSNFFRSSIVAFILASSASARWYPPATQ